MLLFSSDAFCKSPTKSGWAMVGLRATMGEKSSEVIIRDEVTSLIRGNRT